MALAVVPSLPTPAVDLDPSEVSGDHAAMAPYWVMVETILDGAGAMRMAQTDYLPQFPNESNTDYTYRANNAKFTNIYADIVSGLAAKPFAEQAEVEEEGTSPRVVELSQDIDGRGNNLHVFASDVFFHGINYAISWILVDFTQAKPNPDGRVLSAAQETKQKLRPYWVHVPARRVLAVYSATIAGKEEFVHLRLEENVTERSGFSETLVEQVRVFNREPIIDDDTGLAADYAPATYQLWRKTNGKWVGGDVLPVSIEIIPMVPFITGRRKGGTWQFVPPMQDVAYLQVEHYQQETNLKGAKEQTAFPMLAGNGVTPATGAQGKPLPVPVGPKTVLYAPMNADNGQHGEWTYIEPQATSLKFLAEDIKATEDQMREIGRQPLTATAGITVVTAALASQKASSAVQAWAWGLKDALEQAYVIMDLWLKEANKTAVKIFTDFAIEAGDEKGPTVLTEARKNGDLSRETYWEELQRRSILSANFDPEAEATRLEGEIEESVADDERQAALQIKVKKETMPPQKLPAGA